MQMARRVLCWQMQLLPAGLKVRTRMMLPLAQKQMMRISRVLHVAFQQKKRILPHQEPEVPSPCTIEYLLYEDRSYSRSGWPNEVGLEDGLEGRSAIRRSLGLQAAGLPGEDHVHVQLRKFVRACLPYGWDSVSCVQNCSQGRKDNSWGFISYDLPDGSEWPCICRFDHFLLVTYHVGDGQHMLGHENGGHPEPLRLAVGHLWDCEYVPAPGVHNPDTANGGLGNDGRMQRLPDLMLVRNLSTNAAVRSYHGMWLMDLRSFACQVVPTRELVSGGVKSRMFMTASKSSSRTNSLQRG